MAGRLNSKTTCGSLLTAVSALVPAVVSAQTAATQEEKTAPMEEVSITAERYHSTVQTTPVAVTAMSADALSDKQISNVWQAGAEIPGTVIMPNINSSNNARIVMRGAGQENSGINFDQGVGVYIDDVIQPRVNGAFFDFFDVSSVEVLRGPQGTLYGRNSSGGAIKIITKRPTFDWTGGAELAAGDWNSLSAKGFLSGPLVDGKLAFSLSGSKNEHDGYLYSPYYHRRVGDTENSAERVKLLYTPSDNLEFQLEYHFIQDYSEPTYGVPLLVAPNVVGTQANGTRDRDLTITENLGDPGHPFLYNDGGSLHATWRSGPLDVNYIGGIGNLRTYSDGTVSLTLARAAQVAFENGTEAPAGANEGRARVQWYSHELNTTYSSPRLKGVGGLYYYNEKGSSRSIALDSPTIDQDRGVDAWAAYAQGTYTLDSGVGFTVGARHTEEKADFTQYYRLQIAAPQSDSKTFKANTVKLGVNWQITNDLLTYASYTEGFKAGGFNPVPPANSIGGGQIGRPVPYDPENVKSYEAGGKVTTLGGRLRVNLAVFRAEYAGMQLPQFFPGTTTSYTTNATGAIVEGIEYEPTWQVLDSLQIYGSGSVMRGHYTAPFNCSLSNTVVVDCSHNHLKALVPRKLTTGIRYSPILAFIPGRMTLNASWNYNSAYWTNLSNELSVFQPEQADIFNVSISWVDPSGRYKAAVESRNVTNAHYIMNGVQLASPTAPQITGYPNDPRTVMFRLGVMF
ncbi:MAG TPA: TonB-dependent receptor [Steroidobacteraceae bacterium]|nr:TonB-dependent receptor [Steroidobacteraceae bacterium]